MSKDNKAPKNENISRDDSKIYKEQKSRPNMQKVEQMVNYMKQLQKKSEEGKQNGQK